MTVIDHVREVSIKMKILLKRINLQKKRFIKIRRKKPPKNLTIVKPRRNWEERGFIYFRERIRVEKIVEIKTTRDRTFRHFYR